MKEPGTSAAKRRISTSPGSANIVLAMKFNVVSTQPLHHAAITPVSTPMIDELSTHSAARESDMRRPSEILANMSRPN